MGVNRISHQNHTYLKYIFTFSAVTTVALFTLKTIRPHTLTWRWPARAGAASTALGLAVTHLAPPEPKQTPPPKKNEVNLAKESVTKQLDTYGLDLATFWERLARANEKLQEAKGFNEWLGWDDATLRTVCDELDAERLERCDSGLHKAFQTFADHMKCRAKLVKFGKQLETHKLDFTGFERRLNEANQQFDQAESIQDFFDVEGVEELKSVCEAFSERDFALCGETIAQAHQTFSFHLSSRRLLSTLLNFPNITPRQQSRCVYKLSDWLKSYPKMLAEVQKSEHWEAVAKFVRGKQGRYKQLKKAAEETVNRLIGERICVRFAQLIDDIEAQLGDDATEPVKKALEQLKQLPKVQLTNYEEARTYLKDQAASLSESLRVVSPLALLNLEVPCIDDILAEITGAETSDECDDCKICDGISDATMYAISDRIKAGDIAVVKQACQQAGIKKKHYYWNLAELNIQLFLEMIGDPNRVVKDKHLKGAIKTAVKKYRKNNKLLDGFDAGQKDEIVKVILNVAQDHLENEELLPLLDLLSEKEDAFHDQWVRKKIKYWPRSRSDDKRMFAMKLRNDELHDKTLLDATSFYQMNLKGLFKLADKLKTAEQKEEAFMRFLEGLEEPTDLDHLNTLLKGITDWETMGPRLLNVMKDELEDKPIVLEFIIDNVALPDNYIKTAKAIMERAKVIAEKTD